MTFEFGDQREEPEATTTGSPSDRPRQRGGKVAMKWEVIVKEAENVVLKVPDLLKKLLTEIDDAKFASATFVAALTTGNNSKTEFMVGEITYSRKELESRVRSILKTGNGNRRNVMKTLSSALWNSNDSGAQQFVTDTVTKLSFYLNFGPFAAVMMSGNENKAWFTPSERQWRLLKTLFSLDTKVKIDEAGRIKGSLYGVNYTGNDGQIYIGPMTSSNIATQMAKGNTAKSVIAYLVQKSARSFYIRDEGTSSTGEFESLSAEVKKSYREYVATQFCLATYGSALRDKVKLQRGLARHKPTAEEVDFAKKQLIAQGALKKEAMAISEPK
jgi:hypothetical protein